MPRRALRPSFVVTFALSATAIAGGCSSKESGNGNGTIGDSSIGDGGCPAELPTEGEPCDVPGSAICAYAMCQPGCPASPRLSAECLDGGWVVPNVCNPPSVYCPPEAGPSVDDAAPDVYEGGPHVHDGSPDGEGQDGGHD